jgi:hypothetical protein
MSARSTQEGAEIRKPWLRDHVAPVISGHGFICAKFGPGGLPDAIKDWKGTSWLLGGAIAGDRLKKLARGFSLVAGSATLACGVALALAGSSPGPWRRLALFGAAFGIVAIAVFWDGQTERLVNQGVTGAAVGALLLLSAILFPRAFG